MTKVTKNVGTAVQNATNMVIVTLKRTALWQRILKKIPTLKKNSINGKVKSAINFEPNQRILKKKIFSKCINFGPTQRSRIFFQSSLKLYINITSEVDF